MTLLKNNTPPSSHQYLFWVDLEMTGLNPDECTIIEIASIITDGQLRLISEGPCLIIGQSQTVLDKMDDWNQRHHRQSGLYEKVLNSRVSLEEAEMQTLDFLKKFSPARKVPLCGNSIWQDRRFLCRYMPRLETYLHYRNVDVSSVKEIVKRWFPNGKQFPKEGKNHRALDDIRKSIEELKFYREHYFIQTEQQGDLL